MGEKGFIRDPEEPKRLERHPLSELFAPSQRAEDYERIKASIAKHKYSGIGGAIYLYEGKVLDGWNRYRACQDLKIALSGEAFREWKEELGTPAEFVIGKNLDRHMYTTNERAMIAAQLDKTREGERTDRPGGRTPQPAIAKRLKVSPDSVQRAKKILAKGTPELQQAAKSGRVSLKKGAKLAARPKAAQRRALKKSLLKPKPKPKAKVKGKVKEKKRRQVKCEKCGYIFSIVV